MKRPSVYTEKIKGGAIVCSCHGWSVRRIIRRIPKPKNFDSLTYYCPLCWHEHLDYMDEEDCVSCGCPVDYVHCEHPEHYIEYGDGYIPDYCEKCGWNLGRYDRRKSV